VRPDGIVAYAAVRGAMKDWGSEFGYELIDEDWKLEFQPADPHMADIVQRAVDTARRNQRQLAAVIGQGSGTGRPVYGVTSTPGGIVRVDGGPRGDRLRFAPQKPEGPIGARVGPQVAPTPDDRVAPNPQGTQPSPSGQASPPNGAAGGQQVQSLAKSRGRDWGLPHKRADMVSMTRPIRVDCHHDRLMIVPGGNPQRAETITLGPQTIDAVDDFVAAVWREIDAWGVAGTGMYWRPVLNVRVAVGGERRFRDLSVLLEGSGLRVERK